jgi:hypothetical protein
MPGRGQCLTRVRSSDSGSSAKPGESISDALICRDEARRDHQVTANQDRRECVQGPPPAGQAQPRGCSCRRACPSALTLITERSRAHRRQPAHVAADLDGRRLLGDHGFEARRLAGSARRAARICR